MSDTPRTTIYRTRAAGDEEIGFLGADGVVYRVRWGEARPVGRVDNAGRVFRTTAHGERELGFVRPDGTIYSAGLFEGGELGWVAADGVVVQAGLILGEEEVGRVAGPAPGPAAAALLLIFLPDEAEAEKRSNQ